MPAALQPAIKFECEQHIGELRLRVEGDAAVIPGAIEVVEMDEATLMQVGADGDDLAVAARLDALQQHERQRKMREVIDAKLKLETLAVSDRGGIMMPALLIRTSTSVPSSSRRSESLHPVQVGKIEQA